MPKNSPFDIWALGLYTGVLIMALIGDGGVLHDSGAYSSASAALLAVAVVCLYGLAWLGRRRW